jgi:hypothetical protein
MGVAFACIRDDPRMEVEMNVLTIAMPEDRLSQLRELAARFGVAPEDLARAGIEDLLTRPDEAFRQALDDLLTRNAELYRRLQRCEYPTSRF